MAGAGTSEQKAATETAPIHAPFRAPARAVRKIANKANSWSRSGRLVPRARVWYATLYTSYIQQLNLLSPRPLVLPGLPLSQYLSLSLSLFPSLSSLCLSMTYKGFHDELAAMSAMVSARLTPPYSS